MKTRRSVIVIAVILVGVVLTGCEQYATYTPNAGDLTALAEQYHGDDKEMIQETAVARYLTAEAARAAQEQAQAAIVQLEATRQAAEDQEHRQYLAMTAEAQATRDTLSARATQQAINALVTQQAQAVQATATAQAVQATVQAEAIRATQTVEARNWAATSTAEALAREATATAQYRADVAMATQQARNDRATATHEAIQSTALAYQATATRAAEQREIVLGYGRDYGIPIVLFAALIGLGWLIYYSLQEYKKKPVIYSRNFLGDAEPLGIPVDGGGHVFVDLDRQPGAALKVLPSGEVTAPVLRGTGQEERTTARDQAVDAMTRLGAGHRGASVVLPAPPQAPAPGLRSVRILRRLDQAGAAGFLPLPLIESLAADWEE